MRNRHWIVSVSVLSIFLTSCNQPKKAKTPENQPTAQSSAQTFAQPMVAASTAPMPSVKVPGMIQTTDNKTTPPPTTDDSTRDPFAAAAVPSEFQTTILPTQPATQPAAQPVQPSAPQRIATRPIANLSPLPRPTAALKTPILPQQPLSTLPSLPVAPLPMAPPVSRTNLAEAIEVTGIVQIAGRYTAIIQEPNGGARYVRVGDKLANGQVIVKRINMNAGEEPSIVLQQNGIKLTRTVGSNVARAL